MDSSESNPIQPIQASQPGNGATDRSATPPVFSGTITGIKQDKGVQTVEVQYSQGKIRFQADGDFQAGDKVRVSFPGGNAVEVAKGRTSAAQGDLEASGYSLPRNLGSMQAFEESVAEWMANYEGPDGSGTSNPAASGRASTTAPGPGPGAAPASLAQMTLPQLMMAVMEKSGGKEFLGQALGGLNSNMLGALAEALDQMKGDPGLKSALLDMIRTQGRGPENAGAEAARLQGVAGAPKNLDGYWSAEAGAGASPWFGKILEKDDAEPFMSPRNRLQFGGGGPPPKNDPMYRYLLDVGGRTLEVYSSQSKDKGDLADFSLDAHVGRLQAKFMDPAQSLPANLRADFAQAAPVMRQAMQLSSHYLQEFKDEPYFGKLVKDFSEVLAQSGRLDPAAPNALQAPAQPAGLPDQKELDGMLRLFLAFPRDGQQPEKQARIWGDAVRNPQAMMDLLKTLQPEQETSLLRQDSGLRLAKSLPGALAISLPGEAGAETSPEAMAGWLKKLLPESFKSSDLLKLADDSSALATAAGKDHDPSKFLLQAVMNSFPKEEDMRQGKPTQFYFYQGQDWRGLQVTWQKGGKEGSQSRSGPKEPLKVSVETSARNMGKVSVGVTWEPKGAKLDFKNQFHDVRTLFTQSLPELEKSLDYLDFKVTAWTYDLLPVLPEDHAPGSQGGWMRPAGLSDGANLDLFG